MLTAGPPRAVGDDEERMLLAMRRALEGARRLPVRVGVNREPCSPGTSDPVTVGPARRWATRRTCPRD